MRRRPPQIAAAAALCAAACAVLPAAARAGFFAGEPIDGPSPDIRSLGDVDVARDGTGALAYVKRDGGVDHIFVSRLVSGVWQPPERVDAGLDPAGSQPVVAAADGGRLAIAFVSGGQLFAVVRPAGSGAYTAPALVAPGGLNPAIDMSIQGVGYVSFTVAGSSSDVRVARLDRRGTTFAAHADPLDINPAANAGDGARRSRIAVSADGTALVTWGEEGSDGRTHVWARRVFDDRLSTAPQDLTLDDFQGHRGGSADAPDVDIEDDSSFAWVVFRQVLDDGHAHAIARRLVGSQFEAPVLVDGLGLPADQDAATPRIDLSGRGDGVATSGGSKGFEVWGDVIHDDAFAAPVQLDTGNAIEPLPVGGVAENGDTVVAWQERDGPLSPPSVLARFYDNDPAVRTAPAPGSAVPIANPALGPVDAGVGFDVASNRAGDVVIVYVQGAEGERRIVSGAYDRVPSPFVGYTTTRYRRFARPPLVWQAAFDLWGPITYRVEVDGQPVGETTDTKLVPAQAIPDGWHQWRVVAGDRRGQTVTSPSRLLRIDATPPKLTFRVRGQRRRRALVRVDARAADVLNPRASGVRTVRIRFGDGSPPVDARSAAHRYAHSGRYTVRVTASDRVGNLTVVRRRIRIRKG
jgi:hypothetical protein